MKPPKRINPVSKRQRGKNKLLEELNAIVWRRDRSRCILCGSAEIIGVPFRKGMHHILSRGAHPHEYLEERNGCLLCWSCHAKANTGPVVREILHKMKKLPQKYDYSSLPYRGYFDD